MRCARFAFFLLATVVAACSGTGVGSLNSAGRDGAGHLTLPFVDSAFIARAHRASFPVPIALRNLKLPRQQFRSHGHNGSTVGPNDSETLGTFINGGGPYTGIYAQHTAYKVAQFPLPYPSGDTGTELLLAPMTLPSNGACLSAATVALNDGTQPTNYFIVIDYCLPPPRIVAATLIDDAFLSNYVRIAPDGSPVYTLLDITLDAHPNANSTWYLLLQNFNSVKWDLVSQAKGVTNSSFGYSLFQSAYLPGKCPDGLPQVSAQTLLLYNGTSKNFESVTPTMAGTTTVALGPSANTSCFNADASGSATSTFMMVSANNDWWARFGPQLYAANHVYLDVTPSPPPERLTVYPHPFDNTSHPKTIITDANRNFCGVAVDRNDASGRVYVSTCYGPVNVYPRPEVSMSAPLFTISGFANTQSMNFDSLGNLYVPDPFKGVFELTRPISQSSVPKLLPLSSLAQPFCVAIDNAQNLYVIDANNPPPNVLKMYGASHSGAPLASTNVRAAFTCAIDPVTQRIYISFSDNTVAGYSTPLTNGASPVVTLTFGTPTLPASTFGIGFDVAGTLYVNVVYFPQPPGAPVISKIDAFVQPIVSGTPGPILASFTNEQNQFQAGQLAIGP